MDARPLNIYRGVSALSFRRKTQWRRAPGEPPSRVIIHHFIMRRPLMALINSEPRSMMERRKELSLSKSFDFFRARMIDGGSGMMDVIVGLRFNDLDYVHRN